MGEQTRIDRGKRPVSLETTRVKAPLEAPSPERREFETRVALFACGFCRGEALELLDGLAGHGRLRARQTARQLLALDSSARQGRMAVAFGLRPDAAQRLRALVSASGPPMRAQLVRRLPPYLRSLFPSLSPDTDDAAAVSPAFSALAERLVREATR